MQVGCYLAAVGVLALVIIGLAASAFVYAKQSGVAPAAAAAAGLDEEGLHFYIVSTRPTAVSTLLSIRIPVPFLQIAYCRK